MTRYCFFAFTALLLSVASMAQEKPAFRDPALPLDARVSNLVSQLTLEEKISLLGYQGRAVPRLGIPAYNWWNEALHGVARAGEATVFPQAIGLAATFNDELMQQVATAISTEARAKYNLAVAKDRHLQYMGLTFWSPNINIFRDPRWGRGQETYGEDPYLTSRMGIAFVNGMQGNDSLHLKTAACAKHFAVHSGPEGGRESFNAIVDEKDLRETYLPAFHALVRHGVESVMGAYNRVNGEPCNISKTLTGILRHEWGFKGHMVTDCGALENIWRYHKVLDNRVQVAAAALRAGVNLDCSGLLQHELMQAVQQQLITEKEIDDALKTLLRTQFRLGFYDDSHASAWAAYGADSVRSASHLQLARTAAAQSMVLLKNNEGLLPCSLNKLAQISVLGTNSFSADALIGNYHGISPDLVTFVEGITSAAGPGVKVEYEMGCDFDDTLHFNGLWNAASQDLNIVVIGLTPLLEGEGGDAFLSRHAADKADLSLPAGHIAYMKALRKATKKPIIAVVTAGSDMDVAAIEPYADAIIMAWYPGEQGGNALADIIFGKTSPAGRLPVTFYRSVNDLPDYKDYNMKGRTYRYFRGDVQYPFGFGLSYTSFGYAWKQAPRKSYTLKDSIAFSVAVKNTGAMDGDEVVQAYIEYPGGERMPLKELKQFKRVHVAQGQESDVPMTMAAAHLRKWDLQQHAWKLYRGLYHLYVGAHSADKKLRSSFEIK